MAIKEYFVTAGSAAHLSNGGGYDPATYADTYADLMGTNDGPVASVTDGTYVLSTGVLTKSGGFANAKVGMFACVVSGTNMTAGRYTITACDANSITIAAAGTADSTAGDIVVRVGGAITYAHLHTRMSAGGVAQPGDRYNLKAGTYACGATPDQWTADGNYSAPIVVRGYASVPGDLEAQGRAADGSLDTTSFPTITYTGAGRFDGSGANFVFFVNVLVSGAYAGDLFYLGATCVIFRSKVINSSTNAAACGLKIYNYSLALDCDVQMSGASGTSAAVLITGSDARAIGVRIPACPGKGIGISGAGAVVLFSSVIEAGGDGIAFTPTGGNVVAPTIFGNTVYSAGGHALSMPNYQHQQFLYALSNHLTDNTGNAYYSAYASPAAVPAVFAFNRTRNNAAVFGAGQFTDWALASNWSPTTTVNTGDAAGDYVNAAAENLGLIDTAPGKGAGFPANADAGAYQRAEPVGSPTLPDVGNVIEGVDRGDGQLGTYHPTTEAETTSGTKFGPNESLTGTATAGGTIPDPDPIVIGD